jgi:PAS domain S-box-containing protein
MLARLKALMGSSLTDSNDNPDRLGREAILYRALFEQTTDAILILALDGFIVMANPRASEMLNYPVEELARLRYSHLVAEAEREQSDQFFGHLLAGKALPPHERLLRRQDGREFPAEVSLSLVRDPRGQPIQVQCVARDITERKRTEEQLHYQANLLQNVSDAIISTHMDTTIRSWNKAAEKVYGWKAEEVIGKKLSEVVKTRYGDRDADEAVKSQYITRGYWRSEVIQQRKDGQTLYISASVSLLRDSAGRPVGTVVVNHDVTKRKLAELELQRYANQMAALRKVDEEIDSTLDLESVSRLALMAVVTLAGADAGFIVLIEDGQAKVMHTYGGYAGFQLQANPRPNFGIFGRVMAHEQPELVPVAEVDPDYVAELPETKAVMSFPLISRDRMVGAVHLETSRENHFTEDIFSFILLLTGRVALSIDNARLYHVMRDQLSQLQVLYEQVTHLEQLKTDMIRIASHDLLNPLGIANGFVELVRMDVYERMTEAERDYVEMIARQLDRMQRITDDILSLERIQQLAHDPLKDDIELNALAERAVEAHRAQAEAKAQTVDLALAPLELRIRGDSTQIYEALVNLITNAIKYTPEGGAISVAVTASEGHGLIEVRDTGYGIPADQQSRLFQPFFRARIDEAQSVDGVGLGLHLVRNIIERHKGRMFFQSIYGQGSTFGFELPLSQTV